MGITSIIAYSRWVALIGLLLSVCLGCSNQPATYPIEGKIVFSDGTPVQFGEIETYQPERKLNARGTIRKDGTFELGTFSDADGVVAGVHKVVVRQFSASPLSGNVQFETVEHRHGHEIDPKYSTYQESPLEFEMKPGETVEIRLEIDDFTPATAGEHH